jgi:hypothetical protein
MNCRQVRFLSIDYLAGSLSESDRLKFEEHLQVCGECRDHIEQEKNLSSWLSHAAPTPDPGEAYWASLEKAILARAEMRDESNTATSHYRPRRRIEIVGRYLLPLAAAIILIIIPLAIIENGSYWDREPHRQGQDYNPILIGEYSASIEVPEIASNEESADLVVSMVLSAPGLAGRNLAVLERLSRLSLEGK